MNYINEWRKSLSLENHESGREFLKDMRELLERDEVKLMQAYRHHMRVNRYQHLLSVAYLSYMRAKEKELRYIDTAVGAMLHDLFFYDYKDKDKYPKNHNRVHADIALENADKLFHLNDVQRDIISSHMWPISGSKPTSEEGKIVCKADKFCSVAECVYSIFSGKKKIIKMDEINKDIRKDDRRD